MKLCGEDTTRVPARSMPGDPTYCDAQTGLTASREGDIACLQALARQTTITLKNSLGRPHKAVTGLPQPFCKRLMTAAANTRLVIADDHPLFRDALRQAVASVVTSATIDEAGSFEDLTALLEQDSEVDLILLDLAMPGISGFSGLIYLRAQYPAIPVVIVSASDDVGTIRRSLDFGASGFIPKRFGVETLRDAVAKVMDGDVWVPPDTDLSSAADPDMTRLRDRLVTLTPQQVRVLMMLSQGLLNKQIAYELGVSEATIKAHVSAILQKLGVESRTQAVIAAAKIAGGQWRQGTPPA
ncbi:two component transcriptional regulator, LuxR family [Bradyrhizobium lablabi]|uniref:Two component transcriptional regulator, LuxR family n=2 Tax=Bradyrhizobium lablabi TaxID=722472 RepID=A0A1M6X1E3_9BRAD|nr:two component transcriptional regulator, LuxR family [Bradyrhizobium lablabi]